MSKVISITSGKGGVGKTTTAANIATGLALQGHKTVLIDFDIGLRNVDLVLGISSSIVYDICNVINNEVVLNQAIVKHKNIDNLFVVPASDTLDSCSLTIKGIGKIINELKKDFDFIICDSPAGMEQNTKMSFYFADEIIIVSNPEISSVSDSIKLLNLIQEIGLHNDNVLLYSLINRYSISMAKQGDILSVDDIKELLALPIIGVVLGSKKIIKSSNIGIPIINLESSKVKECYVDVVNRLLGKDIPMRFIDKKNFFKRIFKR